MSSSKTSKKVVSRKGIQPFASLKADRQKALFLAGSNHIPQNPDLKHASVKISLFEPAKLIVLNVNSNLNLLSSNLLNDKAKSAKRMFTKYRSNH